MCFLNIQKTNKQTGCFHFLYKINHAKLSMLNRVVETRLSTNQTALTTGHFLNYNELYLLVNKFSLDYNQILVMFDNITDFVLNMTEIHTDNLARQMLEIYMYHQPIRTPVLSCRGAGTAQW